MKKLYFNKFEPTDFNLYFQLVSNEEVMAQITERAIPLDEAKNDFTKLLKCNEEYKRIFEMRRQKVIDIQLGIDSPHLIITLENRQIIFVNGVHDDYECWQAGVQCEDWLVVAAPGNEIATCIPDEFNKK
ncbi:hypothetical protein [Bacillus cereus]|uniref:hypothetical protein n=1 Tax=Bacillus cereus TaxID=1396 RepID=UPI001F0A2847|nr:hypothetical protein [Bacillus cereus]